MKLYEGFFILPPDVAGDARKNQLIALENMIQKFGGKVLQRHELGRRALGYTIRKCRDGYMVAIDFEMEPSSQDGLRRALELHEDLLKHMITNKTVQAEPAPAPAAKPAAAAPAASPRTPRKPAASHTKASVS